jgi:hypothetical protein
LTCLFRRKIVVDVDQMQNFGMVFPIASATSFKPLMHSTIAGAKMLGDATHCTSLDGASVGRKSLSE